MTPLVLLPCRCSSLKLLVRRKGEGRREGGKSGRERGRGKRKRDKEVAEVDMEKQ